VDGTARLFAPRSRHLGERPEVDSAGSPYEWHDMMSIAENPSKRESSQVIAVPGMGNVKGPGHNKCVDWRWSCRHRGRMVHL